MGRMESFSDGVIAVILTIMVLELHAPATATLEGLQEVLLPLFLYALSFIIVASMWVHHHGLLKAAKKTSPRLLWSNNNLLFWMSLIPFATATVGKYPREAWPVAAYGMVFLLTSGSFWILQTVLARHVGEAGPAKTLGRVRFQALFSVASYAVAVVSAFVFLPLSYILFAGIALSYTVPPLVFNKELVD